MWYNPIVIFILKSPLHPYFSRSTLLIEFAGRKTGKKYTLPVSYVQVDQDLLIISLKRRKWWRNLEGSQPFTILHRGRRKKAAAQVFTSIQDVSRELGIYVTELKWIAKHLDIGMDNDNRPVQADLEKSAEKRVILRIQPV